MTLIYCVKYRDTKILHIDGTIDCYQPWQIGVMCFVFLWVVPLVFILIFGPGLLENKKISVSQFFLSCCLPVPFLIYWLIQYQIKPSQNAKQNHKVTSWQVILLQELQKSYRDIELIKVGPVCWLGVIKSRRLMLVIMYTFVSNYVVRLGLMISFTVLFLVLHIYLCPYKDKRANFLFTISLLATFVLGLLNFVKACYVEGLVDFHNIEKIVTGCDIITDIILIWGPVSALVAFLLFKTVNKLLSHTKKLSKRNDEKGIELKEKDNPSTRSDEKEIEPKKPKLRHASI